MNSRVSIFAAIFAITILLTGTISPSLLIFEPAEALKSKGTYLTLTNSKQICGDKLCSEIEGGRDAFLTSMKSFGKAEVPVRGFMELTKFEVNEKEEIKKAGEEYTIAIQKAQQAYDDAIKAAEEEYDIVIAEQVPVRGFFDDAANAAKAAADNARKAAAAKAAAAKAAAEKAARDAKAAAEKAARDARIAAEKALNDAKNAFNNAKNTLDNAAKELENAVNVKKKILAELDLAKAALCADYAVEQCRGDK